MHYPDTSYILAPILPPAFPDTSRTAQGRMSYSARSILCFSAFSMIRQNVPDQEIITCPKPERHTP